MTDSINLTKGESISLTKKVPSLTNVFVGAGWDVNEGKTMDLDLSAFQLDANGKCVGKQGFVYFGNLNSGDASVNHTGDNLTGVGEGDDEVINVDLTKVAGNVQSIVFIAAIYLAAAKGQSLNDLKNAHLRVVNATNNEELAIFKINEPLSGASIVLGELVRDADGWSYKAIGQANLGEIGSYVAQYGLQNAA